MIEPLLSDDALLADIASVSKSPDALHLWWLGQSGYLIEYNDARVLLDPYLSDSLTRKYEGTEKPHVRISRRVIDPARLTRVGVITSSHGHTDHLDAETLRAIREADCVADEPWDPMLIAPRAVADLAKERWGGDADELLSDGERIEWAAIGIEAVAASHPTIERDATGASKYLGYVFTFGRYRVYHSGDTVVFDGLADTLRALGPFDIAILPINGKVGNMNGADAARLAKVIGAKLVIPCHYDLFEFNTADPQAEFVPECQRIEQGYRVLRLGERLTLTQALQPEDNDEQD